MKIKLRKSKWQRRRSKDVAEHSEKDWEKSFPFIVNPRGILTHRAKAITTHLRDGKPSHHSVEYWCANQTCFEVEGSEAVVVELPPANRLVCFYCEVKAEAAGEPTASQLAGRHVHVGVMKAHRVCCQDNAN